MDVTIGNCKPKLRDGNYEIHPRLDIKALGIKY